MSTKVLLEELCWQDVRARVQAVNPIFAELVDAVNPDSNHTVFLAKYPYGSQILRSGKLFLPANGPELIGIDDARVDANIKRKIGYVMGTNPMTMVLKNTLDLYIPLKERNIMYSLIEPGTVFGIWQLLDDFNKGGMIFTPIPLWDMTAGARSLFLLPKISEVAAFHKIQKKYDIKADTPKNLVDHWQVLKDIANHPDFSQPWKTEVLFFSKSWIDSIDNLSWHDLKTHLILRAWRGSDFWRNQFCWDLTLSRIQAEKGIKPCPYVADIASHLLAMSVGATPGLRPLTDNRVAPVDGLRQVFEEDYGSKYAPVLIGLDNFSVFENSPAPIYYSFHYQTAIKLSQKSSNRSSILTDMYNIRSLITKYLDNIQHGDLKMSSTVLYEMAKVVQFSFGHYVADDKTKMTSVNELTANDLAFQQALNPCKIKDLPKNAPFLNGCVQITRKPSNRSQ